MFDRAVTARSRRPRNSRTSAAAATNTRGGNRKAAYSVRTNGRHGTFFRNPLPQKNALPAQKQRLGPSRVVPTLVELPHCGRPRQQDAEQILREPLPAARVRQPNQRHPADERHPELPDEDRRRRRQRCGQPRRPSLVPQGPRVKQRRHERDGHKRHVRKERETQLEKERRRCQAQRKQIGRPATHSVFDGQPAKRHQGRSPPARSSTAAARQTNIRRAGRTRPPTRPETACWDPANH